MVPSGNVKLYFLAYTGVLPDWQGLDNPPNGASLFGLPPLDESGNYSIGGNWMTGVVGNYGIYPFYTGDSNFNPANLVPFTLVVQNQPQKQNVVGTCIANPNPVVVSNGVGISGNISAA